MSKEVDIAADQRNNRSGNIRTQDLERKTGGQC